MNHASFVGYLAFEPELKQSNKGNVYVQNVIRTRSRKKNEHGKVIYDEIPFTAFGPTAEQICNSLHKGSPLCLAGTMTSSQYELTVKNANGFAPRKITSISLTVNEFEFVPREFTSNEINNESNIGFDPYTNPNELPY